MLSIYLICVGKLKEKFYKDACDEYMKRLSPYCKLTLVEIPEAKLSKDPTLGEIANALAKEGRPSGPRFPPAPGWWPCAWRGECAPARSWPT